MSKYRGWHILKEHGSEWSLYKIIDEIKADTLQHSLVNLPHGYEKHFDKGKLLYCMHKDTLYLKANGIMNLRITLDMRDIYDFSDQGRNYEISTSKDTVIIKYPRDNKYLVIKSDCEMTIPATWKEEQYPDDIKRGSFPGNFWVFEALEIQVKNQGEIIFSCADSFEEAVAACNQDFEKIIEHYQHHSKEHLNTHLFSDKTQYAAYLCASKSMDDLTVFRHKGVGLYAGLPWFFQIWTRDEAICLGSLILQKRLHIVQRILMRQLQHVLSNGRIPNRFPFSNLGSADGTGWVYFRLHQFLNLLKSKGLEHYFFRMHELNFINVQLKKSIDNMRKSYSKGLLIRNNGKETWMDTDNGNDTRDGVRIEIQALWLAMLRLYNAHVGDDLLELEKKTLLVVKNAFLHGDVLKDGMYDDTVRPNIFLAHYVYPDLLSRTEWEQVFDNALKKLWLNWGGLSSIDKNSNLFHAEYTGQDNSSYHRGDSWYWVNNLAAISLCRVNKKKYQPYIDKILDASTKEILWEGFVGHHAEISSAKERRSEGCKAQAWSAAMYIELIHELY